MECFAGRALVVHVGTDEEIERRIATRKARRHPPPDRWAVGGWKPEELALLGTMPDEELAQVIGRSRSAVRAKRCRLCIAPGSWKAS